MALSRHVCEGALIELKLTEHRESRYRLDLKKGATASALFLHISSS